MQIFIGYAFSAILLYGGFLGGYICGKNRMIEIVVDMTCERIVERTAYKLCAVTTRNNLDGAKTVSD